jgi:hypothetical protein
LLISSALTAGGDAPLAYDVPFKADRSQQRFDVNPSAGSGCRCDLCTSPHPIEQLLHVLSLCRLRCAPLLPNGIYFVYTK